MRNIFLILFCINYTYSDNNSSLRLVQVFFRHASRTPEAKDTYPTDPHKIDAFLPMGYGQLTNEGKRMAYKLGEILRQRYDNFLGDTYTPEIVEALSTDFDRTKMTVLLVLAGLFPPRSVQQWNSNLEWLPVPYHYEKDSRDYVLKRPNSYCPAYLKELKSVLASAQVQKDLKTYKKVFQYIAKNTKKSMSKLLDVFSIYQTLNAEEMMNLTLPEWTKSIYPEQIHNIAAKQCYYENYNTILKRLNGGRMLSKVIGNMVQKSNGSLLPDGRKIYLYSGHETNVLNILAVLNLFEPHVPKYSSAVIIELHCPDRDGDEDKSGCGVQVLYLRHVNTEPELLKLDGCDELCPLDTFMQITAPHVPINYTAECNSDINLD